MRKFNRAYGYSEMCDLILSDVLNKYRYILANILKKLLNYIRKPSTIITLSIVKNRIKILGVAFELVANRQTDKRGEGF